MPIHLPATSFLYLESMLEMSLAVGVKPDQARCPASLPLSLLNITETEVCFRLSLHVLLIYYVFKIVVLKEDFMYC